MEAFVLIGKKTVLFGLDLDITFFYILLIALTYKH
jgi:hypothetical protein